MSGFSTNNIEDRFVTATVAYSNSNINTWTSESGTTYFTKYSDPKYLIVKPDDIDYKYSENSIISYLKYQKSSDPYDYLQFSIKKFYKGGDGRTRVVIYCNNHKTNIRTKFECYSSISDGSFWRYCVHDSNDYHRYQKGYNYVSSTFINIYLQQFIFSQIKNYNIKIFFSIPPCTLDNQLNPYIKDRIMRNVYVSGNIFFQTLDIIFPPVTYLNYYKDCVKTLVESIQSVVVQGNSVLEANQKLKIYSDLFCLLNKFGINKDISMSTINSRRQFFNNFKSALGEFFLKYFTINPLGKNFIFAREFKIGTWEFNSQIYSIESTYRETNKIYIIYYMVYTRKNGSGNHPFKNIIHIIPKFDANNNLNGINENGLDERYVAGGPLVNKIFDYEIQAPITILQGHDETQTADYRYIGDLTNFEFLPN